MDEEISLKLSDSQAGATIDAVNKLFWKLMKKEVRTPEQDQEMKALNEVLIMFNTFFCDMLVGDRQPAMKSEHSPQPLVSLLQGPEGRMFETLSKDGVRATLQTFASQYKAKLYESWGNANGFSRANSAMPGWIMTLRFEAQKDAIFEVAKALGIEISDKEDFE